MTLIMKSILLMKIQILILIKNLSANNTEKRMSDYINYVSQNSLNKELFYSDLQNFFLFSSNENEDYKNKRKRNLKIFYNTFDNEVNSVYGTGNVLKDVVYKVNCVVKCKSNCCSGEYFSNIVCLSESQCNRKIQKVKKFILKIALISYASLAVLTSLIIFLLFFLISKRFHETRQSVKNAFAAMLFCFSIFFIFPIFLLLVYSKLKRKRIFEILGGEFSRFKSFIATTETKDEEKLIRSVKEQNKEDNITNEIKLEENINFDSTDKSHRDSLTQKISKEEEIKLDSESNLINEHNRNKIQNSKENGKNRITDSNSLNSDNPHTKVRNKDQNLIGNDYKLKVNHEGYSYKKGNKLVNDSDFYSESNKNVNISLEERISFNNDRGNEHFGKETNHKLFENKNISVNEINIDN